MGLQIPDFQGNIPWFLYDLSNRQLITSPFVPGDITSSKDIILAETPIPGLNYAPINPAGGGNQKVSFTIPLIKRNNTIGNILLLQQYLALRNQASGRLGRRLKRTGQFSPTPKVLYYWGTGSQVPLVYWVARVQAVNRRHWVNQRGYPQYSDIDIELLLDETHPLYKAEEEFRRFAMLAGQFIPGYSQARSLFVGRPY